MKNKKGFLKALAVFFCCVIAGTIFGLVADILSVGITSGVGLGILWMGVAYFNQKEEGEE